MGNQKASGVYANIRDASLLAVADTISPCCFVGYSQAGVEGINEVSASGYEHQIGYNSQYDYRQRGFMKYLNYANDAFFWRLNQQSGTWQVTWSETIDSVSTVMFVAGLKSAGSWNASAFKLMVAPVYDSKAFNNSGTVYSWSKNTLPTTVVITSITGTILAIESVSGTLSAVGTSGVTGTISRANGKTEVTLGAALSATIERFYVKGQDATTPVYQFNLYDSSITNAEIIAGTATALDTLQVSGNSESPYYYLDIVGDYLKVSQLRESILFTSIWNYDSVAATLEPQVYDLAGGTDGLTDEDNLFSAASINVDVLKTLESPFVIMNGVTNQAVIDRLSAACAALGKSIILDIPAARCATYASALTWKEAQLDSEFVQVYGRCSIIRSVVGTPAIDNIDAFPSVYVAQAYAKMYLETGRLSLAPAGIKNALTDANYLQSSDFDDYGDELKTNDINYLTQKNAGICVWEQKTNYPVPAGYVSDLQYAKSVSIVRQIRDRLVSFAEPFNFDPITADSYTQLLTGCTSILQTAVANAELTKFSLNALSWTQLEAAHTREVTITVGLYITQDFEVITFDLVVSR